MAGGSGGSGGSPNGVSGNAGASTPVSAVNESFLSGLVEGALLVGAVETALISPELAASLGSDAVTTASFQSTISTELINTALTNPAEFFQSAITGLSEKLAEQAAVDVTQAAVRNLIVSQYKNDQGELGGAGGVNNATITLAGQTYGPYGRGGGGGDSVDLNSQGGFPGGVVLWWGVESSIASEIASDIAKVFIL